jgi:hypothetical protein
VGDAENRDCPPVDYKDASENIRIYRTFKSLNALTRGKPAA